MTLISRCGAAALFAATALLGLSGTASAGAPDLTRSSADFPAAPKVFTISPVNQPQQCVKAWTVSGKRWFAGVVDCRAGAKAQQWRTFHDNDADIDTIQNVVSGGCPNIVSTDEDPKPRFIIGQCNVYNVWVDSGRHIHMQEPDYDGDCWTIAGGDFRPKPCKPGDKAQQWIIREVKA